MNAQGVSGVTTADVPEILTQQPGTAAPSIVTDEGGAVVPQTTLTALFDQNGNYVGSYGTDPSTGAFSAWNAQGQETSFQAFAAEHQLANGATPVASDGGNAVLYNASGQIVGLDVAGYVVDTPSAMQNTPTPEDGDTTVYDGTGQNELGSFGYSAAASDLVINGVSADSILESDGFTASQLSQVEQSLEANGGWVLSNANDAAVRCALIEYELGGSTIALAAGTVVTASSNVYTAQGAYLGSFSDANGEFSAYNQNGVVNATPVMQDDGVTAAQQEAAGQVLTSALPGQLAGDADLRQINVALSAYLLSQAAATPLTNSVDVYDGQVFEGVIGIDSQTGQLALEESSGVVVDVNSSLVAQSGLTASALTNVQQLLATTSSAILTSAQAAMLSSTVSALNDVLQNLDNDPFENLTPAQVGAYTVQELADFGSDQVEGLTAAQINGLSTAQIQALNAGGFSATALAGLSSSSARALTPTQIAELDAQQVQALGTLVDLFTPSQFGALTWDGVPGLTTPALAVLDDQQLQALTPTLFSALSDAQVAALSPTQLAALSATQVDALSASQINALSMPQIQALDTSTLGEAALDGLSESAVQSLSQSQVGDLSANQVDWLGDAVEWFTAQQVGALSSSQMQALSAPQLTALSATQLSMLAATQLAALAPNQIAILTASQTEALDGAQLSLLNTAQIDAVEQGQLMSLAESQLGAVSTAANGPILTPNPGWQPYGVPTVTSDGTNTTTTSQMWNTLTDTLLTTTAVNGQVTQYYFVTYAADAGPSTDNPQITGTITQTPGPNGSYTDVSTDGSGQVSYMNVALPYLQGTTTSAGDAQFVFGPTTTVQLTGPGGSPLGIVSITSSSNFWSAASAGADFGTIVGGLFNYPITSSTPQGIVLGAAAAFAASSGSTLSVVFNTSTVTGTVTLGPDANLQSIGLEAPVDINGNLQFANGDTWSANSVLGFETQTYTTANGTVFTETDGLPTTAVTPDGSEWAQGADGNFQYVGPAGSAPPGPAPSPTGSSDSSNSQPPDGEAAPVLPTFLGGQPTVSGSSNSGTTSGGSGGASSGSDGGTTSGTTGGSSNSGTTSGSGSGTTTGGASGTPSVYTVTSAGSGTISGDENAGANGADGGTSTNGTTSGTHGGAPGGKPN